MVIKLYIQLLTEFSKDFRKEKLSCRKVLESEDLSQNFSSVHHSCRISLSSVLFSEFKMIIPRLLRRLNNKMDGQMPGFVYHMVGI